MNPECLVSKTLLLERERHNDTAYNQYRVKEKDIYNGIYNTMREEGIGYQMMTSTNVKIERGIASEI